MNHREVRAYCVTDPMWAWLWVVSASRTSTRRMTVVGGLSGGRLASEATAPGASKQPPKRLRSRVATACPRRVSPLRVHWPAEGLENPSKQINNNNNNPPKIYVNYLSRRVKQECEGVRFLEAGGLRCPLTSSPFSAGTSTSILPDPCTSKVTALKFVFFSLCLYIYG